MLTGSYSSLSQQSGKVWHSKEDVLFGYQKISCLANGADILAPTKGPGMVVVTAISYSLRQRQAI